VNKNVGFYNFFEGCVLLMLESCDFILPFSSYRLLHNAVRYRRVVTGQKSTVWFYYRRVS